jgi:hypothetical protein
LGKSAAEVNGARRSVAGVSSPHSTRDKEGLRTFDLYFGVGVLLYRFEVVLVVVVIVRLHHVAVGIKARRIAL